MPAFRVPCTLPPQPPFQFFQGSDSETSNYASDYNAMEATSSACKKKRWSECNYLSMPSPPATCAGPAYVQHALYISRA